MKEEGDSVERWTRTHRGEMKSESTQVAVLSPERETQVSHMTISETISCDMPLNNLSGFSHIHKLNIKGNVFSDTRSVFI